jgi:hypothetical protein
MKKKKRGTKQIKKHKYHRGNSPNKFYRRTTPHTTLSFVVQLKPKVKAVIMPHYLDIEKVKARAKLLDIKLKIVQDEWGRYKIRKE